MTFKQKIAVASLGNALLVIVVGAVGAIGLLRSADVFSKMNRQELREVDDTEQIARAAAQLNSAMDTSLAPALRGDTKPPATYATEIENDFEQIDRSIAGIEDRLRHEAVDGVPGSPDAVDARTDREYIDIMKSGAQSARRSWADLSSALESHPNTERRLALMERVDEVTQSLTDAAMNFQRAASVDMMRVVDQESRRAEFSVKFLAIVALAAIGFALLLGWSFAAPLVRRLSRMKEATGKIGAGDLDARIDVGTGDEIGQLGTAFNEMAAGLCRSRDELKENESKFRELAEAIREVFWIVSPDCSKLHYVSPAYEEVWGRSLESVYKNPLSFTEAISPEDRPRVLEALKKMATDGMDEEYRLVRPDGQMRWIHSRGFAVRNETGQVQRVVGIAADVTKQKMAEDALRRAHGELEHRVEARTAELQQANKALRRSETDLQHAKDAAEAGSRAKSEFLARMSHEIRTPLNGVVGMADLLLGSELSLEQASYAELAKSSADVLLHLVNDILDFSKIEAGKLELEQIEFEIHNVVESIVGMLVPKAAAKGLEIASFVDLRVPTLLIGDSDRLRQILINLVNNALKFTEHGAVTVRVNVQNQNETSCGTKKWLRFDVEDTGIGIPPERLNRLFRPFSQVDSSTTRQYGGTGLGLAICRELIELMGGKIGVRSEFNRGSTFWFIIPFTVVDSNATARAADVEIDVIGLHVLVVSGQEVQRDILCHQLTAWGMNPVAVLSAEEAIKSLQTSAESGKPIRVVLVDSAMPQADDATIARRIRSNAALSRTTLLLLTPVGAPLKIDDLDAAGYVAQISKPVRQSQLFDRIMDALARDQSVSGRAVPRAPISIQPMNSTAANKRGTRVLLVEDNVVNQKVAATYLARAGYDYEIVRDGQQAVDAACGQTSYDLVLMDCQMPIMDGFEATRAIRNAEAAGTLKHRSSKRLPIVALTANAIKGDREACLEAGMDDYLGKPLNATVMVQTIERTLERMAFASSGSSKLPAAQELKDAREESDGTNISLETQIKLPPPLDYQSALNNCEGDQAFLQEIIGDFRSQATNDFARMAHAFSTHDADGIGRAAHSLKGTAAYLRAEPLRAHAEELEHLAKLNALEAAAGMIDDLKREVERCIAYVHQKSSEPLLSSKLADTGSDEKQTRANGQQRQGLLP